MELSALEMAFCMLLGIVILVYRIASKYEKPEPILEDEQDQNIVDHSASPLLQKHDVFLSFRGTDTRDELMSHLYHELQTVRGIQTFMDARGLEIGDPISPTLLKAIEESNVAVVVLSKNYASSPWCLDELAKICQCMQDRSRILPLFYHVDPSDVRHQNGKFGKAFTKLKRSRRYTLKVEQWRNALKEVAQISGCNTKDHRDERKVVEAIVESVCSKVRPIEFEFVVSSREFELFGATSEAMDRVMDALKEKTVVGVYGTGGIGKTAMVEQVGARAQKMRLFTRVIMAVISQEPKIWNIQGTFADMLGVKLMDDTEIGRACTLRKRITRENRILVILDDIWKYIDLSRIGIPSLDELKRCNSKVLLTTRRLNVFHPMKCQAQIHLGFLNEDDSWKLFLNTARRPFNESTDFLDVARDVARECAGLPVALIAVANALGDKKLAEWERAADRLKHSEPPNPEEERVVFDCIKLSYDYLKTDDAKSCFLLCCLFPEDYDIQIEDLLKYGIGKGLFRGSNMKKSRDAAHTVVESLKDSSLLLDAKKDSGCVRMHDVIRDVALSISLSEDGRSRQFLVRAGCELQCWPMDPYQGYIAISLMRNNICMLPGDLVLSELQILLLQSNFHMNEIPGVFFASTKALSVLDLSQTSISLLPSSFNILTNLQTLYLDGLSLINNLSPLGNLKELKVLSMRELPLEKLPNEVGQLTKLRMLDFTSASVDMVPSKVICNLIRLEELYMQCNFVYWGSKAEENEVQGNIVEESKAEGAGEKTNALFDELIGLSFLHILKVFISDAKCLPINVRPSLNWEYFDICISGDPDIRESVVSSASTRYSRALTLDTTIDTLPEWFIHVVTKKTEKLQFIKCRSLCNILVEYEYGRLHALKYLSVIKPNKNLKQLMNASTLARNEPVFQKLEELHLVQVDYLKELCVGQLPTGSLCNLRLLKVRGALKLESALLQSNMLQRLQNLEKLICEDMEKLEYVFASDELEPEKIELMKLTEMRLCDLGNLIQIWNGPAPCEIFRHVKVLVVHKILQLKYLFTSEVAQCLDELEDLSIQVCPKLQRVIEASEETVNKKIVLKKLKNITLVQLSKLTRFYGSTGSATTDKEDIEFPSLESSYVHRCSHFLSPALTTLNSKMIKLNVPILSRGQREAPNFKDYPHHNSRTFALGERSRIDQ